MSTEIDDLNGAVLQRVGSISIPALLAQQAMLSAE